MGGLDDDSRDRARPGHLDKQELTAVFRPTVGAAGSWEIVRPG